MNPPEQPQPPQALCAAEIIKHLNPPPFWRTDKKLEEGVAAIITKHFPAATQDTSRAGEVISILEGDRFYACDSPKIRREAASLLRALSAENAGQVQELTDISKALGTFEGHSSVDHILALRATLTSAESENARLREELGIAKPVLARIVEVIEMAGAHNLMNGVQLGQFSWYHKMTDALTDARVVLAPSIPFSEIAARATPPASGAVTESLPRATEVDQPPL